MVEALVNEETAPSRKESPTRHRLRPTSAPKINWPPPPEHWPELLSRVDAARGMTGTTSVHVWVANLDVPRAIRQSSAETLSRSERERAARFHFEQDRSRYIVGRGLLRTVLGQYLGISPGEVPLVYGPNGKPLLGSAGERASLYFNLAHAQNLALLAVTITAEVGVDVEFVRPLRDAGELVRRFFSARENAAFEMVDTSLKPAAFFNLWTRKEAWLKATGKGIGHLLNQVEVSFLPREPAKLLSLPGDSPSRWSLANLAPAPAFAAALAVACTAPALSCWHWNHETPI